jgi:hypothetical protein
VTQPAKLSVISKQKPRSLSIFELASKAGVKLWQSPSPRPFDNQFVRDLVAMRRSGLFSAVWIDADKIRVRTPDQMPDEAPQRLTRLQADMLIAAWRALPPSAGIAPKRKLPHNKSAAPGLQNASS